MIRFSGLMVGVRRATLLSFAAVGLAACGGSGGSSDSSPVPVGAIDGGGLHVSAGPINGFGSVIVNGVRYDTSGAQIIVDDNVASESDLKVGQFVLIAATGDDDGNLSADRIIYDDTVHTPMASLADDVLFISFNGR